ncbi:hypothetical protein PFISCL1PPCAC_23331, partial [Pristionchus fissidentatus]
RHDQSIMWRIRYWKDYTIAVGAFVINHLQHKAVMPSLVPLQSIEQLSPRVIRVLGQNPGAFTLQGTNTYLVGEGPSKILIDTGEPNIAAYIDVLKDALEDAKISAIICTHWHADHTGGCEGVLKSVVGTEVPVYKIRNADPSKHRDYFDYVDDGHEVKVEGATVRFVTTPGHTTDHASLWLEEESALFSGDCILGQGTTVFEDLYSYMQSLERIKGLKPAIIYPGHGPVVEKTEEKVDEYIKHRVVRENEIMKYFDDVREASTMDVCNFIYKESPLAVKVGALGNVRQHCLKLVKDGRLTQSASEYFCIVASPKI